MTELESKMLEELKGSTIEIYLAVSDKCYRGKLVEYNVECIIIEREGMKRLFYKKNISHFNGIY